MKLRIMIIDDEQCIRDSLKWHLEDLGHAVTAEPEPFHCNVYRGESCPKSAACTDVLLIDQNLPFMTGLEFIRQLKEKGCKGITSHMLLMSGDTTSIDHGMAQTLGCTVVQKPMSFEFLGAWLETVKAHIRDSASETD